MFNEFSLGNFKCPCHHCKDRTLTCDSACDRYKKYKEQIKEYREDEHKQHIDSRRYRR